MNAFGVGQFTSGEDARWDGDIEPYRFWLRLGTDRFEARVGLQKINFGSATLLRPLMWFDSLDPRDPLQLTDGVTDRLFTYQPHTMRKDNYHDMRAVMHCLEILDRLTAGEPITCGSSCAWDIFRCRIFGRRRA